MKLVNIFVSIFTMLFIIGCTTQPTYNGAVISNENYEEIPLTKINSDKHSGAIDKLILSKDRKYLLSSSWDRSVKIWSADNYDLIDTIRYQLPKSMHFGITYQMDISPNNKFIALDTTTGDFNKILGVASSFEAKILIFNRNSREIEVLNNVSTNESPKLVTFLKDDLLLIVNNKEALFYKKNLYNKWNLSNKVEVAFSIKTNNKEITPSNLLSNTLKMINNEITQQASKLIASDKKYFSVENVAINDTKTKIAIQFDDGKSFMVLDIKEEQLSVSTKIIELPVKFKLSNFEFKDNKILINVSKHREMFICDSNLNIVQTLSKGFDIAKLSPSENKIYAYNFSDENDGMQRTFYKVDIKTKTYISSNESLKNGNISISFDKYDNPLLITEYTLNIYDKEFRLKGKKSLKNLPIISVGFNNDVIGFTNETNNFNQLNYSKYLGKLSRSFDLKNLKVDSINNFSNFNRIAFNDNNYSLDSKPRKHFVDGTLVLSKDGKNLCSIEANQNSEQHSFYGFIGRYIASGSEIGDINIYDRSCNYVTQMKGHEGAITSLAFQNDILISSSEDGIIKVWNTKKILEKNDFIYPNVSLFITDNQWVMWTPEGYFDSSENGYKYIGFHINQGYEKEAKWVGIEKLYDHFYRPDLVKLALQGEDIKPYTKGLSYLDVLKNPAPEIKITKVDNKTINSNEIIYNKDEINLEFDVKQVDNGGVGIIRIYQEGKLVKTIGDGKINRESANVLEDLESQKINQQAKESQEEYLVKLDNSVTKAMNGTINEDELIKDVEIKSTVNNAGIHKISLPLKASENKIEIEAFNKSNTVASIREKFTIDAKIQNKKPTVYAIIAGVNEFEDNKRFSNLKYSENDAKAINEVLQTKVNEKVVSTVLLGKDFTKENLFKAINDIKSKAKLEDKLIFYVSTHGKVYKGDLHIVPQNNKQALNFIKFEEMFKEIQSISALDQIFIIDACESGQAKDIVSSVYDSKASVLAKQSGVHVLLATAKGTFAFEHPNPNIKHGVFTNNILTALKSKITDENNDKKISILELSRILKNPEFVTEYQYPIIRNVGQDTKVTDF